jgi:hypothetical protein
VLTGYQQVCAFVSSEQTFVTGNDFFGLLGSLECGGYISLVGSRSAEKIDGKV